MSSKNVNEVEIRVITTRDVKALLSNMSKKFGIKQSELCGLWMSQIDPNNEQLIDKILDIRALKGSQRLSQTRNALIAKLHGKKTMQAISVLDNDELKRLIQHVQKKIDK